MECGVVLLLNNNYNRLRINEPVPVLAGQGSLFLITCMNPLRRRML
jgi:hypothetical protein